MLTKETQASLIIFISLAIVNSIYILFFSDNTPSLQFRLISKLFAISILASLLTALAMELKKYTSKGSNVVLLLLVFSLILAPTFLIPAQASENSSNSSTNSTFLANISQQISAEKIVEGVLLAGIILSPVSILLSIVALWVAMKNRKKTFKIK